LFTLKRRKSSPSKIDDKQLRLFVPEHPDAYLREIAEKFGTTLQAAFYASNRLEIALQKRPLSTRG